MSSLRLYLCGPLAVEHEGITISESRFPGRQGRRLWAYLVLERDRPVPREELATAVWGDDIPDVWGASLNALVSRLRNALRGALSAEAGLSLQGGVGRYQLAVPDGSFIDLERGWRALLRAERALRERDAAGAAMEALIARGICGRGFLPGEAGPWIEAQRRALADTVLQALEIHAGAELVLGNHNEAHRLGRELLGLDALRESGYRILMRALAASGNGAQAVRVMAECRDILRAQADTAPSSETERVFREVVRA